MEKETAMKRLLVLFIVMVMAAVFGSVTLVNAECAYHKSQASVDKATTDKEVVAAPAPAPDTTTADQVRTAQAPQPAQPAAEVKK
jgi:hypothetical protein